MEKKYFDLARQAYNRKDSVVDGVTFTSAEKNEALREKFKELVPDGKNRYRSFKKNENEIFDIYKIIDILKVKRPIFVSEADFQLELAWVIKEEYPNAKVRLECCPSFDRSMHIDILVIIDNEWIPIELKYKTKGCVKVVDNEKYNLKNQGAKDIGCYLYLKDIQRIEKIKDNINNFNKGYSIFLTNELSYTRSPKKSNTFYEQFSLGDNTTKKGILEWHLDTSSGTKKGIEKPIVKELLFNKME
jgi:hypothetical protein